MFLILLIPEIEWLVEEKCVITSESSQSWRLHTLKEVTSEYHRDIGVTFLTWASMQPQPQCNKHLYKNFLATNQNTLVSCNKQTRVIYYYYKYFILLHAVYGDEESCMANTV